MRRSSSARSAISRRSLTGLGDLPKSRALTDRSARAGAPSSVSASRRRWLTGEVANLDYLQGDWDAAAPRIARLAEEHLGDARSGWGRSCSRGTAGCWSPAGARRRALRPWLERAASGARNARDLQMLMPSLAIAARAYEELGDDGALALAARGAGRSGESRAASLGDDWLKELWFVLDRHGLGEELRPMLARLAPDALGRRRAWRSLDGDLAGPPTCYAQLGRRLPSRPTCGMRAADRLAPAGRRCGGGRRGAARARVLPRRSARRRTCAGPSRCWRPPA